MSLKPATLVNSGVPTKCGKRSLVKLIESALWCAIKLGYEESAVLLYGAIERIENKQEEGREDDTRR